jgi:subtilase-type serine protease
VTGGIGVTGGELRPGLTAGEAALISGVPGNVLTVGGAVRIGRDGRLAVAIRGADDYTSVRAAGDLSLSGELTLNVRGALTPGTVLTVISGKSISGKFRGVAEGQLLTAGGYVFRASYRNNSVTLTVLRKGSQG